MTVDRTFVHARGSPGERAAGRRLQALMGIAATLAGGGDAASVLQSVVDAARFLLDADSARLELLEVGPGVRSRRLVAVAGTARHPVGTVRPAAEGVGGYTIATGLPVLALQLSERRTEPPEAAATSSPYLHNESGIAVPLKSREEVIGTLAVLDPAPYRFDRADVETMEQFAVLASMAAEAGRRLQRDQAEAARLRALYLATEQVGEGIALFGPDGTLRYANPAYEAVHGSPPGGLDGCGLVDQLVAGEATTAIETRLARDGETRSEAWVRHRSGRAVEVELHATTVADPDGRAPIGTVVVMHEIGHRKAAEAALHSQARTDALTGLANRRSIIEAVAASLARRDGDVPVALLFVDLDRFKKVNDGLGHRVGDALLVEVARRFAAALGPDGRLGRLGGDEFVVLLEGRRHAGDPLAVARRLAASLRPPIGVEQRSVTVTASIGVAVAEADSDVEALLRDADTAMYQAKAAGRDTEVLLDRQAASTLLAELDLEADLRDGIGADQLRLAVQPVVDLRSGRLVGIEALVRWAHPTRGLLLPADFLPLAEETGLIRPIGAWVLRRAAEVAVRYLPRHPGLALGVNVSARQLVGDELVAELDGVLAETGLPASALVLELTETLAMRPSFEPTLHRLRRRGVRLAIDDLGTGYSNLAYLKHLPVSLLKIDQSFVTGLGVDDRDDAIVAALLGLGASLGMEVVAEGIETPAQLATLRRLGCPSGQGNLLGPAMDPPAPDGLPDGIGVALTT